MRTDPSLDHRSALLDQRLDVQRLVQHAAHLDPADRALLEGIFDRGMSPAAIARVAGVRPTTIRLRVKRLVQRINSPAFRYVLRSRASLSPLQRRIADAVILRGQGQRKAAATAEVTVHQVRREIDRIRAIAEHTHS